VSTNEPALSIDMGGNDFGWQLAVVEPGTLRSLRGMSDDEVGAVTRALSAVREHTDRTAANLLLGAHERLADVISMLRPSRPLTPSDPRAKLNAVAVPLVSWLLMWAMFLDHALHDISDKYPNDPDRLEALRQATHDAFDRHAGYRMAEGLRDYVAHRGMPPLRIEGSVRRGANAERLESIAVSLDSQRLLTDSRLNRHVRQDIENSTAIVELTPMIGDAMVGMHAVMTNYAQLLEDHIQPHLERLVDLLRETAPSLPVFLNVAEGFTQLQVTALDDVIPYLIARGYVRDSGSDETD
jgi:hypothetical protein